jgi:hypothetical protein
MSGSESYGVGSSKLDSDESTTALIASFTESVLGGGFGQVSRPPQDRAHGCLGDPLTNSSTAPSAP